MKAIQSAAVIGAGTMGSGIAQLLAQHDIHVVLNDIDSAQLEHALDAIGISLDRLIKKERLRADQRGTVLERIERETSIDKAVREADLVIEAAVERMDVKRTILSNVDKHAPARAILATNTSSLSITALAAVTDRPDRVVGMHFFNPVPVMRLVEIVRGLETSEDTFDRIFSLARRLDKDPVAVNDAPGFVANRILLPMINEAAFCVMEGVASVESVDAVMQLGMAHPMGPLKLADLIGLDVCLSILEVLHREMGDDKYRPCPYLRKMVAAGRLGRKTGRGFYNY